MKKYFLFLNLISVALLWTVTAEASKKKYRYIKREHGVTMQGSIPTKITSTGFETNFNFAGSYAYNWKGMAEFGPYLNLNMGLKPFSLYEWSVGVLGEYNFIKNRGKRKFIPSAGIKVGTGTDGGFIPAGVFTGVHGSLKAFVDKRTAIVTTLAYTAEIPLPFAFSKLKHHIGISSGFAYYFDFY